MGKPGFPIPLWGGGVGKPGFPIPLLQQPIFTLGVLEIHPSYGMLISLPRRG